MTMDLHRSIGASSAREQEWDSINWDSLLVRVRRLLMRIAKAIRKT